MINEGNKIGKLTIIKKVENSNDGHIRYLCKCDCGNEVVKYLSRLKSDKYNHCCSNCSFKEANKKHGLKNTRLYNIWQKIKQRCYSKNNKSYKNYGGRGIEVCDEWLDKENGFINFYNWAMNNGYKDDLTIDRIDNNGNYEPNNCRWATTEEQSNNKRNNILIENDGVVKTAGQWAKIVGISSASMWWRFKRHKNDKRIFEKQWIDTKWKNQYTKTE